MIDYIQELQANRSSGPEYAATSHAKTKRKRNRLTSARKRAKLKPSVGSVSPGKGKQKPPSKSLEGSPMAKKKGGKRGPRKSGRLTKAEIKKAGGIKQAWAARKGRAKVKRPRSSMRKAVGTEAPKKRPKPRKGKSKSRGGKKKKSGSHRSSARHSSRTQTTRTVIQRLPGHTTRIAVVPVPAAARRSKPRKSPKKKKKGKGKGSQKRMTGGFGHRRRTKGAMENPMTGTELFVGGVTGVMGFLTADFVDRLMATHSLTVATAATASTAGTYTDTPPTTGDYAGLYNATAICAPMDAKRWIVGILTGGVPLTIAHFIAAPMGRSALQFFGVAALFRIVGKGMIDLVAMVAQPTQLGQQLYDGEMRASMLKANAGAQTGSGGNLSALPSAGLGKAPARLGAGNCGAGCACDKCKQGAGYPPPVGAGYPSQPREVARQTANAPAPPPPPPSPLVVAPPQPVPGQNAFTGAAKPRSRFSQWGDPNAI